MGYWSKRVHKTDDNQFYVINVEYDYDGGVSDVEADEEVFDTYEEAERRLDELEGLPPGTTTRRRKEDDPWVQMGYDMSKEGLW